MLGRHSGGTSIVSKRPLTNPAHHVAPPPPRAAHRRRARARGVGGRRAESRGLFVAWCARGFGPEGGNLIDAARASDSAKGDVRLRRRSSHPGRHAWNSFSHAGACARSRCSRILAGQYHPSRSRAQNKSEGGVRASKLFCRARAQRSRTSRSASADTMDDARSA